MQEWKNQTLGCVRLFPAGSGVCAIAEPGRYFVEGGFVMYARIFSKREIYSRALLDRLLYRRDCFNDAESGKYAQVQHDWV